MKGYHLLIDGRLAKRFLTRLGAEGAAYRLIMDKGVKLERIKIEVVR